MMDQSLVFMTGAYSLVVVVLTKAQLLFPVSCMALLIVVVNAKIFLGGREDRSSKREF